MCDDPDAAIDLTATAIIRRVPSYTKHGPGGTGARGACDAACLKCAAEQWLRMHDMAAEARKVHASAIAREREEHPRRTLDEALVWAARTAGPDYLVMGKFTPREIYTADGVARIIRVLNTRNFVLVSDHRGIYAEPRDG